MRNVAEIYDIANWLIRLTENTETIVLACARCT